MRTPTFIFIVQPQSGGVRVTIPKPMATTLGINAGDHVSFALTTGGGIVITKVPERPLIVLEPGAPR